MSIPRILPGLVIAATILAACGGGPEAGLATSPTEPPGSAGSGGVNAPDKRDLPHVVIVSIDGFRWDYPELYSTPSIARLIAAGVRAESLRPVFPAVTFPNHYSIATGLNPSNHGIVANAFPSRDRQRFFSRSDPDAVGDGSWYGGEPIWVAAEADGLVTATYFFVGSEAEIGGIRPTYWQPFDPDVPGATRVAQVVQWLAMPDETRPHLVTLYFDDVDSAGHQFGPESAQTGAAVAAVDGLVGQLLDGIEQSPVAQETYVILVSDHGMSTHLPGSTDLVLTDLADLSGINVIGGGPYAFLYFDRDEPGRTMQIRDAINANWVDGKAYLRADAPAEWQVTATSRFPELIVQADDRYRVAGSPARLAQLPPGIHGWAPAFRDMHGIFVAAGPGLLPASTIGTVSVLDVYPLMMKILDIPLSSPIDGDPDALAGLLVE